MREKEKARKEILRGRKREKLYRQSKEREIASEKERVCK